MLHLSAEQIERYTKRTCSAEELFAASQHLSECDDCRKHCLTADSKTIHSEIKASIELEESQFEHPTYEEMERYVDGEMQKTEREILEMHFDHCADCGAIERDLRYMRLDLVNQQPVRQKQSTWQPTLLKAAVLAACSLLLFTIAWLIPIRSRVKSLESQIIHLKEEKATLEKTSEDLRSQMANLEQQEISEPLSREQQLLISEIMSRGQLVFPDSVQRLIGSKGQLMGTSTEKEFTLLKPVGTLVETETPTFEWSLLAGAQSYTVSIYDLDFKPITNSPPLTETNWQLPMKLERGREYAWQVVGVKDGVQIKSPLPPEPPAMFGVLSALDYENLPDNASHLTNGILLARYGLLDRAEEELQLAKQTPSDAEVAEKFLKQIQSLRNKN
jgi:hypothetical protein